VISKLLAVRADIVCVDTALTRIAAKWWNYMVVDNCTILDFVAI